MVAIECGGPRVPSLTGSSSEGHRAVVGDGVQADHHLGRARGHDRVEQVGRPAEGDAEQVRPGPPGGHGEVDGHLRLQPHEEVRQLRHPDVEVVELERADVGRAAPRPGWRGSRTTGRRRRRPRGPRRAAGRRRGSRGTRPRRRPASSCGDGPAGVGEPFARLDDGAAAQRRRRRGPPRHRPATRAEDRVGHRGARSPTRHPASSTLPRTSAPASTTTPAPSTLDPTSPSTGASVANAVSCTVRAAAVDGVEVGLAVQLGAAGVDPVVLGAPGEEPALLGHGREDDPLDGQPGVDGHALDHRGLEARRCRR